MRYFFHIAYNGYYYHGWQRQIGAITVQQVIEEHLARVLKAPFHCVGCGRTDAKVHASQFFFHVDIKKPWDYDLIFRLNKILPEDISVFEIIPVLQNNHARFDAINRTYDYYIHTKKNPFLSFFSSLYPEQNFQLEKMQQCCDLLPKYNEYFSFCKTPEKHSSTRCQIHFAQLYINEKNNRIRFQIKANRYLRSMIRIIVIRLLMVGKGQMSVEDFEEFFYHKTCGQFPKIAHPQGLHLSKIEYPFLDVPAQNEHASDISWIKI